MTRRLSLVAAWVLLCASAALGQANGNLQIHFMDVGQGDGAVLISPGGQVVLFDDGAMKNCDKPVSYLQQLGITKIDYHITSHYHSDHIGCAAQVFQEIALPNIVLDRGQSYPSSTYKNYVTLSGSHRQTATAGQEITLDGGTPNPVKIVIVALSGNGIQTTNENDLSLVAVVHFGSFTAEFGGDLSGFQTDNYQDIETSVAPLVGQVQVYKVHHHCSRYSTNDTWLATIKPQIGIVSAGDGNSYGHPTAECLERLHKAGVKTYWTETGNGADPDPAFDTVAGNVLVQVAPGAPSYTVTHAGANPETYPIAAGAASGAAGGSTSRTGSTPVSQPQYAWSKSSSVYHFANCRCPEHFVCKPGARKFPTT